MKIWLFEPYEWDYCGGAIAVIARDFHEATKLVKNAYTSKAYFADSVSTAKPYGEPK